MESDNRVCVFSSVCVLLVGGKVRSGGGHGVPALPVVVTSAAAPAQAVTEEEIMQGWREVAETNCTMDVYAMPDGVSPSFSWHKRGTFGEWARLDLGGFSFPFGTNDEAGGMLYVSVQNIRKLVRVDGDTIAFPYAAFIPPHGGMSFSIDYGAEMYSDSQGDITVMASLTPVNSGETLSNSASITVAKIALRALTPAPLDENVSRHEYGIGEAVVCRHWPSDLQVSWCCQMGRMEEVRNDFWYLYLPLTNDIPCRPRIQSGEASYSPTISIREPIMYYCKNAANISTYLGENVAGGAGMSLELYIEPRTVCFGGIALEEVPTTTGAVGGYFENEEFSAMWAHTRERRAGQWQNVGNDNLFMLEDEATMGEDLPPMAPDGTLTNDVSFGWRDGAIIWTIPLGWNEHGTIGETDPIKTNAVPERQTFIITPNGTLTVVKAGFFVSRGTNTQIRLERVQQ